MGTLSSPALAPVDAGDILDGKYRVDRVLGVGGMGVVVAATHIALDQRVALKFLLPAALSNPSIVERFAREARATVQIQSEHVARVMDVGTLPGGSPYIVMEYLEGADLADALEKGGPMPVQQAVGYVLQACEAVAEAHALGIVHRDLKPANLFLARRPGRDPIVKVLDFGISKTKEGGPSGGLTQTAAVLGSPYYMAPEQMMSSKDVDPRTDVWALGVILYELLSGAPPFNGDTMAELVFLVTQRDAPPLQQKRPEVPQGLAAAIATCLSRDPARRFPDTAKLAAALAPFGPARSEISLERIARVLGASMPPSGSSSSASPMRATASTWARSQASAGSGSRTRIVLAGSAVMAALVIGVVGWLGTRGTAPKEARSASATSLPSQAVPVPPVPPAPPSAALAPLPDVAEPRLTPSAAVSEAAPSSAAPIQRPPLNKARPTPMAQSAAPASPPPPAPASRGLNMGMKE
jgi:serine/threonine-protein kinase